MYIESLKLRPNARGETEIACPRCHNEFWALHESIKHGVRITCSKCQNQFQFDPTKKGCLTLKDEERVKKIQNDWILQNMPQIKVEY